MPTKKRKRTTSALTPRTLPKIDPDMKTIDKIKAIASWAETMILPPSPSLFSLQHLQDTILWATKAIKKSPGTFLDSIAFITLVETVQEMKKQPTVANSTTSAAAAASASADTATSADERKASKGGKAGKGNGKKSNGRKAGGGLYPIMLDYPASALRDKSKLSLLPLPVSITTAYGGTEYGEEFLFFDWFAVDKYPDPRDPAVNEFASIAMEFLETMIEALNEYPAAQKAEATEKQ